MTWRSVFHDEPPTDKWILVVWQKEVRMAKCNSGSRRASSGWTVMINTMSMRVRGTPELWMPLPDLPAAGSTHKQSSSLEASPAVTLDDDDQKEIGLYDARQCE
jgi:hypothetical protein